MSRESALKAWSTRRANAKSAIAKKAVETRKLNQLKEKRRQAALLAWKTRRKGV
jgi:hypothetical protein